METIGPKIMELGSLYGLKIIAAIVILIVGRWAAGLIKRMIGKTMISKGVDITLQKFVTSLIYFGLLAFVVIAALGQLGIQTASLIAILGAAGLAVGLALQGSLSNFAAGVLMLVFRPFKVGDIIEAAGVTGSVEEIQIFTTQLKTPDNKTVIIPNSKVTGDNIVNWTTKGTRRVDMVMGIGYDDDIDKARSIMAEILSQDERILKEPEPTIAVSELADSSVNFVVRPWVKVEDYWGVHFNVTEKVKKRFDQEGISIPYPQQDVHMYQHSTG